MADQQINEAGQVALKHYTSNPVTVQVGPEKVSYSFVPKLSISMAWINPEHVDTLLNLKARVCCGNQANKFRLANALDVCLWETGERC